MSAPLSLPMWRRVISAVATLLVSAAAMAQQPMPTLTQVHLIAGIYVITAEVASTSSEHEMGLMFRPQLGTNDGMLFTFGAPSQQCMWMRNTLIPLSVAFMDEHGTIVNIEDMQPQTETSHCSAKPVAYALEMNLGWFAKRGIKPGSKIARETKAN